MKRTLPLFVVFCLFASISLAQTVVPNSPDAIEVSGELQSSIAVNKAKVGDEVVLKLAEAVKQDGKLVIPKDSRILGTIVNVVTGNGTLEPSSIYIKFDRLETNGVVKPIAGLVASIASIDKKLRSLEADYERALNAAATTSSPVNSLEATVRQGYPGSNGPGGSNGPTSNNPSNYRRKTFPEGVPPSNMPQTFSDVEEAA